MPRSRALTGSELRHLSGGRRVHGDLFSLTVAPLPGARGAKSACIVSKKVAPTSVARNTLRRRCRAALWPRLKSLAPAAYVFSAKRAAAGASYADIERDITALLARL